MVLRKGGELVKFLKAKQNIYKLHIYLIYMPKKQIIVKFEGSEILERKASKFGTGAHVIIPKEYINKKVKIIMEDEDDK